MMYLSADGSAFYASTGLHRLITIVPIKFKNKNSSNIENINYNFTLAFDQSRAKVNTLFSIKNVILLSILITLKNKKKFY